jgi:hypothetical protein
METTSTVPQPTGYHTTITYETPPPQCITNDTTLLHEIETATQPWVNATARLLQQPTTIKYPTTPIRVQIDGGANRSITNDITILSSFRNIKRYAMNGVAVDGPALYCTGLGLLPWRASTGEVLMVKCYYSSDAAETIISPNDVVTNHITDINAWGQYCNIDTGQGNIEFHRRDTSDTIVYQLASSNGLWYHHGPSCIIEDYKPIDQTKPTIQRLTQGAQYELYHQRFGHPGERAMKELHKFVNDVPQLKGNSFYKCASCMHSKSKQRAHHQLAQTPAPCKHSAPLKHQTDCTTPQNDEGWWNDNWKWETDDQIPVGEQLNNPEHKIECSQHIHIDYGFMKGSGFSTKDEEGRTITSLDGYRSYCLIIDKKSRYTWVFLTKTKSPPINLLEKFLKEHGNKNTTHKTIRTDQGGELWASQQFRQLALEADYLIEPTGSGAPFQNGLAERPNQTLGTMVRCLLHAANLGPEYWPFALLHAVYLKNRLPHRAINDTPYHVYTGNKPSAKHLRIFGCPVIIKNPGRRPAKLDMNTSAGRFLGYTATDKNVYYIDNTTRRIKIATHCQFDEAGMTLPPSEQSPASKALQQMGYTDIQDVPLPKTQEPSYKNMDQLHVKLLSEHAKIPVRATAHSAGYDLYSPINTTIAPNQRVLVPLDIQTSPRVHMHK